jgi:hypothetical protein
MKALRFLVELTTASLLAAAFTPAGAEPEPPRLRVSESGRLLMQADGRPFFWLGDTAWELLHRLTREQIEAYLTKRAAQRFNVIQVVALPEINGLTSPNRYGEVPLVDLDPARPNEQWFALLDFVVTEAARRGLYVAILPTWGAYAVREESALFAIHFLFSAETAASYGRWIGSRYRERANVIWILGGDRAPDGYEATWRAMAAGIAEGVAPHDPLLTYHPRGPGSSGPRLHAEPWLDFNLIQSGHTLEVRPHELIAADYARTPAKPVINGEPAYEGLPIGFKLENGRFTHRDVRRNAYWSVFAGAAGITYGANEVWMMWSPDLEPISARAASPFLGAEVSWAEALDRTGATQMRHLRALIESRPMQERIPAADLLVGDPGAGLGQAVATRARGGSYAMVFYPQPGQTVTVNLSVLSGSRLRAWWFNPRSGKTQALNRALTNVGEARFVSPTGGPDWVLVLDDASRRFPPPGEGFLP